MVVVSCNSQLAAVVYGAGSVPEHTPYSPPDFVTHMSLNLNTIQKKGQMKEGKYIHLCISKCNQYFIFQSW